jgi:uracil phosphoribosyltransferase
MVINLSEKYSVLCDWIAEIRDEQVQKDRMRFRYNMERLGEVAAYEISRLLPSREKQVQTSLGTSSCKVLDQQPVLATILRAGIPLHTGLYRFFDQAESAFAGAYRKHHENGSFDISLDYLSCPPLEDRILILADPMLATGASLVKTLNQLSETGQPAQIHIVSAIAATEGIRRVLESYAHAFIWAGAIDTELNDKGYIIPGLGDAGDLAYGNKAQQ